MYGNKLLSLALAIIACLSLASCQKPPPPIPLKSPLSRGIYRPFKNKSTHKTLPDPGFLVNLTVQNKPVSTILDHLSHLGDFPIGLDQEAGHKSLTVHMTLIAQSAPLDTLVNYCARALGCNVFWWSHEPLVWFGNTPPPLGKDRRFHAWSLETLLSDFQVTSPPELIVHQPEDKFLDKSILNMRQAIEEEEEKNPALPSLKDYLKDDPLIKIMTERIGEGDRDEPEISDWVETLNPGNFHLESLKKRAANHNERLSLADDPSQLIRFIIDDLTFSAENQTVSQELITDWVEKIVYFLKQNPSLTLISAYLPKEILGDWSEKTEKEILTIEALQKVGPSTRLKLYRQLELFRKLILYNALRQQRYEKIFSHVSHFSEKQNQEYKKFHNQLKVKNEKEVEQLKNYFDNKKEESQKIVSLIHKFLGNSANLKTLNQGNFLIGSLSKTEAHLIDTLLNNLKYPEIIDSKTILYKAAQHKKQIDESQRKLVSNDFHLTSLNQVLYEWALESGVTLGWAHDDLPEFGQRLITKENGSLPFFNSLAMLSKEILLPALSHDGNNCYWLGTDQNYHFVKPRPSRLRVFTVPDSLRSYSAEYLVDYLNLLLGESSGFISSISPHRIVVGLDRTNEEYFLTRLAEISRKGKLPEKTQLPNSKNRR